jgi:alpha-galactosidase
MISFQENNNWVIEMANSAYAFGISSDGHLIHRYWGVRLPFPEDYPPVEEVGDADSFNMAENRRREEYPAVEGSRYFEPGIVLTLPDGVRDLRLRFAGVVCEQAKGKMTILLKDMQYEINVHVHYLAHFATDVLERWVEVVNGEKGAVQLSRAFSSVWQIPQLDAYWLSFYTGKWSDEMQYHREQMTGGKKVLEGRRITTGHDGNSWFAVDDGTASEEQGNVWFGALAWSGNWKTIAEMTQNGFLQVLSGVNDWDLNWQIKGGETFVTPHAVGGFSASGFGGASRRMHDHVREGLPHGQATRKVLYNSWEATTFDVDVQSQIRLAEIAAEMGVELFVLDDGWFHRRNGDTAGLGDWWPDEVKFPSGLTPLIEAVNDLGMDFGLWIEPEMVNPDSELFRTHPDWVIQFPGRSMSTARGQCILNMGRVDVQDHLIALLDEFLQEHNVRFVKWDMNRNVSEPGWEDAPGDPRELWIRYVYGVYRVWEALRERHPDIIFQSCSGGGGRADLGILAYADQIWASDNTEATSRLKIQEGFAQLLPAATMESWVTDQNADLISLAYRFHVSMCGVLGVGGDIGAWSSAQRNEAYKWIERYKEIRHLVHWGDRFLLRTALEGTVSAVMFLDKEKENGVLFVFRTYESEPAVLTRIYLRGLKPEEKYKIDGKVMSGAAWGACGLDVSLKNFESQMMVIQRIQGDGAMLSKGKLF